MEDPQNDKPCRDCKRLTQNETERCDECSTPAGRLLTVLIALGIKSETSDDTDGVIVNGLFVDAVDCGWGISGNGDDLDGNIEAAANAIAAIVQAPALRAERDALAAEVERLRLELEKPVAGAWEGSDRTGWFRFPHTVGRLAGVALAYVPSVFEGTQDKARHGEDLRLLAAGYRLVGGVHPLPSEVPDAR